MPVSEAQKRASKKWNEKNTQVMGVKFRKEQAEQFKSLCADCGVTPSEVIKVAVNDLLMELTGEPLRPDARVEYMRWTPYIELLRNARQVSDPEVRKRIAVPFRRASLNEGEDNSPTQKE